MDLTRRFVFRGNASAIAGQIVRPKTIIVDVNCGASSLGVSGGRSQSKIGGMSFGDIIKLGSAFTLAEGLFDDEKQAAAVTDHKGRQSELSSTTTVTGEAREMSVGIKPLVTHQARARHAREPFADAGSGEPSIVPARDTTIQGVMIGGNVLTVNLNVGFFQKYDTRSKVLAAADDPKCFGGYGSHFVDRRDHRRPTAGRQTRSHSARRRHLRDDRQRAEVGGQAADRRANRRPSGHRQELRHGVLRRAPRSTSTERRLTMVRFELGSPIGGYCDFVDVGSNGSGFP